MLDFLKRFGLGVVYVLSSPFLLAFLILWTLYTFFIFLYSLFNGIKNFFKGKKFFSEFKEDIEAKKILSMVTNSNENNQLSEINSTVSSNQNIENNNNNELGDKQ